jgi:hypothetical protein
MYEPVLEFDAPKLIARWEELFSLLSVETLRAGVEADLKAMYDKLCLSSLDQTYPNRLLKQIGSSCGENAQQIEKHVRQLYVASLDEIRKAQRDSLERLNAEQAFDAMESPIFTMETEAGVFVRKSLSDRVPSEQIFNRLTHDFESQSIFRKEQSFLAVCLIYRRTDDEAVKSSCCAFFERYAEAELPLLNQVECSALRVTRKANVISMYPAFREELQEYLKTAPELVRFVHPPYRTRSDLRCRAFGSPRPV